VGLIYFYIVIHVGDIFRLDMVEGRNDVELLISGTNTKKLRIHE
jgi:hypothetical protein